MDKSEAAELKNEGGRLRPVEAHVKPLPWSSLEDVHEAECGEPFEWTPQAEEAFLLLVSKGYSVARITGQGKGWPTYADFRKKLGTDACFKQMFENRHSERADSLVEIALGVAENSRSATVQSDRLLVDVAFRTAAALNPEKFGNKTQVGVSGGLILAAGSLADLAAKAAQLHTNQPGRVTGGAQTALPAPDNVGQNADAQ